MLNKDVDLISICMVTRDLSSQIWLSRVADIKNGRLERPIIFEGEPKLFDNRDRLYYRDGPSDDGVIGTWHWTAKPNKSGTGSDYVETEYVSDIIPVEIIELPGIKNDSDIIRLLKEGIELKKVPTKFLISSSKIGHNCQGMLCNSRDFEQKSGKLCLKTSVSILNKYSVETYKYERGLLCRNINLGDPIESVLTKDFNTIVKEIILKRASWTTMKARGMSKAQWGELKSFISHIDDDTLYDEIASNCNCSKAEAVRHLSRFMDSGEAVLAMDDIDERTLEKLVLYSPELFERCTQLAEKNWLQANAEKISTEEKKFLAVKDLVAAEEKKIQVAEGKLSDLSKNITLKEAYLESLNKKTAEQKQLCEDIEVAVQNKIKEASENIANFISEQLFIKNSSIDEPNKDLFIGQRVTSDTNYQMDYFSEGEVINLTNADENSDWKETLFTITNELYEAGVEEQYCFQFGAWLYAAFINRKPLLLAGPCGEAIANAFSVSLFGKTASTLTCSSDMPDDSFQCVAQSDSIITIIKNPFQGRYPDQLYENMLNKDKFFIVICPYIEDLEIEPHGIFNYMLPVFTELFIDKTPSGCFSGGVCKEKYEQYRSSEHQSKQFLTLMKKIKLSKLNIKGMNQVVADYQEILQADPTDGVFLFLLFPYAYCTGKKELLREAIAEQKKLSKETSELILDYLEDE